METVDEYGAAHRHHARAVGGIDDAFYQSLVRDFASWDKPAIGDSTARETARMLLEREARLLDERRYEEWLALFAAPCVYWIPARPGAHDPRQEVSVAFDDHRRLEDRIYRLRTGSAWSQAPASRTVRLVSNVEVFDGGLVRANFLLSEFRSGDTRVWAGWCGYRLKDGKIEVKQVNLVDCDQHLRNPSLVL